MKRELLLVLEIPAMGTLSCHAAEDGMLPAQIIKPQPSQPAAQVQVSLTTLTDGLFCSKAKPQSQQRRFTLVTSRAE